MLKTNLSKPISVSIIGAGPNGLCAAAFLRAAGAEVHIFGIPMESWKEKMPKGMLLRSTNDSSSIASPGNALSIERFKKATGCQVDHHPTIDQFIAYSEWYQNKSVPDIDQTRVRAVRTDQHGFTTELEDGREVSTRAVVLATGINPFPYIPEPFAFLPKHLATHSSDHKAFDEFQNKDVVVIGKGQSALESAALLHESGARVEVITRGTRLTFIGLITSPGLQGKITSIPTIHQFLYPPTDLAGPPNNWAIADIMIYRGLSKADKEKLFELIGPIGSGYLEPRLAQVRVSTGLEIKTAAEEGNKVCLTLSDGSSREVDHVIFATGFRPNINRLPFISNDLKAAIEQEDGYPTLTAGYESSSLKGFYVVGALSCRSQGPINRFVCGTYPVGQYLTEAITGSKIGYPDEKTQRQISSRRLLYRIFQVTGRKNL